MYTSVGGCDIVLVSCGDDSGGTLQITLRSTALGDTQKRYLTEHVRRLDLQSDREKDQILAVHRRPSQGHRAVCWWDALRQRPCGACCLSVGATGRSLKALVVSCPYTVFDGSFCPMAKNRVPFRQRLNLGEDSAVLTKRPETRISNAEAAGPGTEMPSGSSCSIPAGRACIHIFKMPRAIMAQCHMPSWARRQHA